MSKVFLLLDGNSILYRAYYATSRMNFRNSKDIPTGCLSLVISTIEKYIDLYKPEYFIIAFDHGKITFRTEEYEAYKKQRPKMPPDLYSQMQAFYKYLEIRQIPILKIQNYEADDIIGTIQKDILEQFQDAEIIIISSDQDILQLVNKNTKVMRVVSGFTNLKEYNWSNFSEQYYGLLPTQIPLLKALSGDSSDNITGIKGIGYKTAISIISKFPSLEEIYAGINDLSKKSQELLEGQKELLIKLQRLVTIYYDVPIKYDFGDLKLPILLNKEQASNLTTFYQEYELNNLLKKHRDKYQDAQTVNILDLGSQLFKASTFLISYNKMELIFHKNVSCQIIKHIDNNSNLTPEGVTRLLDAIRILLSFINNNSKNLVFATEFLRRCKNQNQIISSIKKEFDIDIDLLSSEDECELNYLAFSSLAEVFDNNFLVLDVGGGSVEFINIDKTSKKNHSCSHPIGTLQIKKLFPHENYKEIYEFFCKQIQEAKINKVDIAISGSGSIYTAFNLIKHFADKNINRHFFNKKELKTTLNKILHLDQKAIHEITVIEECRKDIIKYIFIFLVALFDELGLEKLYVSKLNIRIGYLIKKGYINARITRSWDGL